MSAMRLPILAFAAAFFAALVCAAPAPAIDPDVHGVLTRYLGFTPGELATLQRGGLVEHSLDSSAATEFGVTGAVRVNAPKTSFLDQVRDIVSFKRGPGVLQVGRFSNPPRIEDLAGLTVGPNDFDATTCRVGDCDVRLSADAIEQVRRGLAGRATDGHEQAAALFKEILLADVSAYLSGGPGRMRQYDADDRPIRPIDAFNAMVASAPAIGALVPGLPEHLREFPAAPLPQGEDFLYWSKEEFGRSPFISVTHVTLICPSAATCVMATKDVYSSRYIDASLAIGIATDVPGNPGAFYLVYANRTRASALKGWFSSLRRALVGRRARAGLGENLVRVKARLESRTGPRP